MPSLLYEETVRAKRGAIHVAGLDEAGRGAIAGPVVAGAVILPLDQSHRLARLHAVNDSKQLSAGLRAELFETIIAEALAYGIGSSSAVEIDEIGIISATIRAMTRALRQLVAAPEYLLIDGRIQLRGINLPQQSIIRGDSASLTIAAASILAKVARDREMVSWHILFPQYGFDRHKGYCTRDHEAALATHGPCPLHRFSFAPIRRPLL